MVVLIEIDGETHHASYSRNLMLNGERVVDVNIIDEDSAEVTTVKDKYTIVYSPDFTSIIDDWVRALDSDDDTSSIASSSSSMTAYSSDEDDIVSRDIRRG